jgi:hypothetical protein
MATRVSAADAALRVRGRENRSPHRQDDVADPQAGRPQTMRGSLARQV